LGIFAILYTPIEVVIDSYNDNYFIRLGKLIKLSYAKTGESYKSRIQILFWRFTPDIWSPIFKALKKDTKTNKKLLIKRAYRIISTFRLKKFRISIDTGNYIRNAYLYPLTHIIHSENIGIDVNYRRENNIMLQFINRPINIIFGTKL